MVVFLTISGLVVLFVLFVQPPEGPLRRQALRAVLTGRETGTHPAAVASVPSQENVAASTASPSSQHHQKRKPSVAHGAVEPPSVPAAPVYQLRKPSMMFEKYDEACHVTLPPSSSSRAPQETTKRGFFRALISRIRKGHLQVNPYYTTLTEDAPIIEEGVVENPATKPSTRRSFDRGKGPTPDIKKRIGFQEEPLMQMEGEQLTGANTPTSTQSASRRHRRSQSIRPMTETEISSRCRVDRSMSVFATVTPGSSVPGLRPLKSGIKGSVTPKLGAPAKRTGSMASTRRTVNFTGE
ncbi:hypothetical protein MTO96_001981 [Rhipicephalus appendiculatus]